MLTQLVLIDGLPGLGKTTAAEGLGAALRVEADHPVEIHTEYSELLQAFWTWGDGATPGEKTERPYDTVRFINRLMRRTYDMVDQLYDGRAAGAVAVVESYPFQSPLRNMWKMGGNEALPHAKDYFNRFASAVGCLNPLMVYFTHGHWRERMAAIEEERGPRFIALFYDAFLCSPYATQSGLSTRGDVLDFYEEYDRMACAWLDDWPHRKIVFDPIPLGASGSLARIRSEMLS